MPLSRTALRCLAPRVGWLVAACLLVVDAPGQQPSGVAAPTFQPHGLTRQTRRLEQQLEALAADEAWDESLTLLETPGIEPTELVEAPPLPETSAPAFSQEVGRRYTPFSRWVQSRLATLPEPARLAWLDRVESVARRRYEEAATRLDEDELARVAEEFFATPSASEALLAASELAMERGDHSAARRRLQRLHPLASDPFGRPAGVAMATIDPAADPAALAQAWRDESRPADLLAAPADDALLPTVLARLALISIREGDFRRAAGEAQLLRALAPEAVGRIAGREQPLVEALDALIAGRRESPSPARFGPLFAAWTADRPTPGQADQAAAMQRLFNRPGFLGLRGRQVQQFIPVTPAPRLRAVSVEETVFYLEKNQLKQFDPLSGKARPVSLPGLALPKKPSPEGKPASPPARGNGQGLVIQNNGGQLLINGRPVQRNGRQAIQIGPNGAVTAPQPSSPTSTVDALFAVKDLLVARVIGSPYQTVNRRVVRNRFAPIKTSLLAVDPQRPKGVAFRLEPPPSEDETPWSFGSAIAERGGKLYALVERRGVRPEVGLACYATEKASLDWLTPIGSGSQTNPLYPAGSGAVTLSGDTAYVITGLGGVAAIDSASGQPRWAVAMPQTLSQLSSLPDAPKLAVDGDRVLAAPAGSGRLLAWDAATGRPLWDASCSAESTLVGVARDGDRSVAVLAGRRVSAYDTLTGQRLFAWPDNDHAGVRGLGSAALRGDEVFWPTRDAVYTLDALTGQMTRPPVDLSPLGGAGASLLATDHGLLIAGSTRVRMLIETAAPKKAEPENGISRLMDPADAVLTAQLATP